MINKIQCEGAKIILGISTTNAAITEPPPCALLREAGLHPAHVLHAIGLLRFHRMVLTRTPDSLLHRAWHAIQSRIGHAHKHSVNIALEKVLSDYPQFADPQNLPPPENKMDWKKQVVNPLARAEIRGWTNDHIATWGRVAAYSHIATEISTRVWNAQALPPYLTIDGLKKSERRNIAVFRTQCAAYVATHAAHRDTDLFGDALSYGHRHCIWTECTRAIDDAEHVLLKCPLHDKDRATMLLKVRQALAQANLTVDDVGPPTLLVQLLLGSIPPTVAAQLGGNSLALRDILRASAGFIKDVHATRWTYGHKFQQRD